MSGADAEMTPRPSRSSAVLVMAIGALVPAATAAGGASAPAIAAIGVAVLAAGALVGRQTIVDVGAVAAFLGVAVAAAADAPAPAVLAGLVAAVVAWDAASNAIVVGRQLGREAATLRVEALHALASGTVGAVAAGAGLVLFRLGPSGQPTPTLFVLLAAAAFLLAALNR